MSVEKPSSNVMKRMPSPPDWKKELFNRGAILVFNQLSAVLKEQLWASSHTFGTINEKSGSALFARSVFSCVNGTIFIF